MVPIHIHSNTYTLTHLLTRTHAHTHTQPGRLGASIAWMWAVLGFLSKTILEGLGKYLHNGQGGTGGAGAHP